MTNQTRKLQVNNHATLLNFLHMTNQTRKLQIKILFFNTLILNKLFLVKA
jgi:hypothetical protein